MNHFKIEYQLTFKVNQILPHFKSTINAHTLQSKKLSHLTARWYISPTNNRANPPLFLKTAYKFTKVNLAQIQSVIYYARLQLILEVLHTLVLTARHAFQLTLRSPRKKKPILNRIQRYLPYFYLKSRDFASEIIAKSR